MQGFNPQIDQEREHLTDVIYLGEEYFIEMQELQKDLARTPAKIIINVNQDTYEPIEIQKHY